MDWLSWIFGWASGMGSLVAAEMLRRRRIKQRKTRSRIDPTTREERPDIYFETFGHPWAPIKHLDFYLAKLPAGYGWEFEVNNDRYQARSDQLEGDWATWLKVNLIHLLNVEPNDRVVDSFAVDLTWKDHGQKLLWSTHYREEGRDKGGLFRSYLAPIINWSAKHAETLGYKAQPQPTGYYLKKGG